jgi:hypothetical protein
MNKNFSYIIRSNDREVPLDDSNNCTIKLNGLPQQYRYFKCDVIGLYLTTHLEVFTCSHVELRADNGIDIMNGWDTNNNRNATVGFTSLTNAAYSQSTPYTFTCGNFNGRSVSFKLYCGDENNLLTSNFNNLGVNDYNNPWVLVLNMTGIED